MDEKKVEAVPATEAKKFKEPQGLIWREGTNARALYNLMLAKGADGMTSEELFKAAEAQKIESDNLPSRVKRILGAGIERGIIAKAAEGKYIALRTPEVKVEEKKEEGAKAAPKVAKAKKAAAAAPPA